MKKRFFVLLASLSVLAIPATQFGAAKSSAAALARVAVAASAPASPATDAGDTKRAAATAAAPIYQPKLILGLPETAHSRVRQMLRGADADTQAVAVLPIPKKHVTKIFDGALPLKPLFSGPNLLDKNDTMDPLHGTLRIVQPPTTPTPATAAQKQVWLGTKEALINDPLFTPDRVYFCPDHENFIIEGRWIVGETYTPSWMIYNSKKLAALPLLHEFNVDINRYANLSEPIIFFANKPLVCSQDGRFIDSGCNTIVDTEKQTLWKLFRGEPRRNPLEPLPVYEFPSKNRWLVTTIPDMMLIVDHAKHAVVASLPRTCMLQGFADKQAVKNCKAPLKTHDKDTLLMTDENGNYLVTTFVPKGIACLQVDALLAAQYCRWDGSEIVGLQQSICLRNALRALKASESTPEGSLARFKERYPNLALSIDYEVNQHRGLISTILSRLSLKTVRTALSVMEPDDTELISEIRKVVMRHLYTGKTYADIRAIRKNLTKNIPFLVTNWPDLLKSICNELQLTKYVNHFKAVVVTDATAQDDIRELCAGNKELMEPVDTWLCSKKDQFQDMDQLRKYINSFLTGRPVDPAILDTLLTQVQLKTQLPEGSGRTPCFV